MDPEGNYSCPPEDNAGHQQTRQRRPRSRKFVIALTVLLAATAAVAYYLNAWPFTKAPPGGAHGAETQPANTKQEYYCPMHTHYKSDKPGNCPICSMKLLKVEKPSASGSHTGGQTHVMPGMPMGAEAGSRPASATPSGSSIFIAPQRQQLIGVNSVPAAIKPLVKEIRTVGKVTHDETKLTHIHTKVTGYIEEVFVDFVGKAVKKGDPLFTIYSPDLVATQEEYLLALKSRNVLKASAFPWVSSGSDNLLEATRRRLSLWDIADEEIQSLEQAGKVKRALTIYSPVTGIVIDRTAYHHGRYVNPEMDLYTIVDLSTVWVLAEIYEYELPFVEVGQTAEIEFPYVSKAQPLGGQVTYIYPHLNPKTRTAQVRLEFPNPALALRPDMFFNVKLQVNLGRQLVVPDDAVLDTGTEQYVFVDKGEGYFEPRRVQLGAAAGGYFAIQSGLKAGERVVTAANFILDSESRLKGAFANMGKPVLPAEGKAPGAGRTLSVEIQEPRQAKVGKNTLRLAVKDASGKPVEDAEVEVTLLMPQMGGMPPMSSKAMLKHKGQGEYAGTIDVPMAWTWQTTVTVRKAGKALGSLQTNLTAR